MTQVSLPSEDKRVPNVFEFGTSYKDILTKLEERGLDKYQYPLQNRDIFLFILIYFLEMSTLGARISAKCWSATRLSSGLRNVGKTTRNSERA